MKLNSGDIVFVQTPFFKGCWIIAMLMNKTKAGWEVGCFGTDATMVIPDDGLHIFKTASSAADALESHEHFHGDGK